MYGIPHKNISFNWALNRTMALWQARLHWPRCARFLYNTYKGHAELVIQGGEERLYSREGVTQGDPLSMLMYALATMPLITSLQDPDLTQCWYADDSSAQGTFNKLREWWDKMNIKGPDHGYFPQGQKSYLVVHPENKYSAENVQGDRNQNSDRTTLSWRVCRRRRRKEAICERQNTKMDVDVAHRKRHTLNLHTQHSRNH